jgi:hypothetical protein
VIECALIFQNTKVHPNAPDYFGKGVFRGVPFKITAVRRTSRSGRPMLKLFLTEMKAPECTAPGACQLGTDRITE